MRSRDAQPAAAQTSYPMSATAATSFQRPSSSPTSFPMSPTPSAAASAARCPVLTERDRAQYCEAQFSERGLPAYTVLKDSSAPSPGPNAAICLGSWSMQSPGLMSCLLLLQASSPRRHPPTASSCEGSPGSLPGTRLPRTRCARCHDPMPEVRCHDLMSVVRCHDAMPEVRGADAA
eukprot:2475797-Rhodomonas_salina.2